MRFARFLVPLMTLLAASLSCSSPGDPSALASFGGSSCKKEVDAAFAPSFLYTDVAAEDYPGLKCLSWKRTSTAAMLLDLVNFEGACGASWTGEAAFADDGSLRLDVINPDCEVASCGWCIYDWSFEVLTEALPDQLGLTIGVNTCPDQPDALETTEATLPLSTGDEGVVCRYAHYYALEWQASALGACGTLHMPCSLLPDGMCADGAASPCQGDLVCASASEDEDQRLCLAPCAQDSDCPIGDLLGCDEGLCRLKQEW